MDNPSTYNIVSLCAGVGGLDLGVDIARPGSRTVAYVEREAAAIETLAARMAEGTFPPAPIWTDLTTFDGKPWRRVVDCLVSGDPCQPNSVAGKGLGEKDDRWLAGHVIRIVDEMRPARVFRENVPGNADGQLAYFIPALERLGYRVAAGIFSAAEVGFSHRRERLFIMADYAGERPGETRPVRRSGRAKRPAAAGELLADHRSQGPQNPQQPGQPGQPERGIKAGSTASELHRTQLANAENFRHERDGRTRDGRLGPADESRDMGDAQGDAQGDGRGQGRPEPARQFGVETVDGSGIAMGDAERGGNGRNTPRKRRRALVGIAVDGAGDDVVDDADDRRHGLADGQVCARRDEPVGAVEWLPLAAPGPSDPRWPDIIRHAPHLEPAIRRVDARLASRVDELRAAGNGVSSLAAAFAWCALDATLAERD